MGYNFLPADRNQLLLLPPSLAEWLPEDHLAYFVLDAVGQMDLEQFYAAYRSDGWGGALYDPTTIVPLLLYAYCIGVRSSRQIERACHVDVAFRVLAANQRPDHTTIARFRKTHALSLAALFTQSLRLCAEAGMAKVGIVALDGTKMGGPASLQANKTAEYIEGEVKRMLAEADEADATEDAEFGEARGDEPPAKLRSRAERLARFEQARAIIEAEQDRAEAAYEDHLAERRAKEVEKGGKLRGRKPKAPAERASHRDKKVNTTDPESCTMMNANGFVQGFNAQAVVSEDQVVVAAGVTNENNDAHQLHPMIKATNEALEAAGVLERPQVLLADAGYCSTDNLEELGPDDPDSYISTRNPRKNPAPKEVSERPARAGASPIEQMDHKVSSKAGRDLYKKRQHIVEPVFGQIKDARGARRFMRKGKQAADSEWKLLCATNNLLKLYRRTKEGVAVTPWARIGDLAPTT